MIPTYAATRDEIIDREECRFTTPEAAQAYLWQQILRHLRSGRYEWATFTPGPFGWDACFDMQPPTEDVGYATTYFVAMRPLYVHADEPQETLL